MAIYVNPLNANALASLAGNNVPRLDLPNWGLNTTAGSQMLLQGATSAADLQQRNMALKANAMIEGFKEQQANARNTLNNYTSMLNNQNTTNANIYGIDTKNQMAQQQLAEKSIYDQGQLGIGQQNAGTNALNAQTNITNSQSEAQYRQAQEDRLKFQSTMQLKQYDLNRLGASSSVMLMGLNQYSGDPQKQQQFMNNYLDQEVAEGILSPEDAQKQKQMDPASLAHERMRDVIMAGAASQAKNSNMQNMMPNMTNIYGNIGMDKATTTQAQEQAANIGRSLIDVAAPLTQFNPDVFSYGGQLKSYAGSKLGNAPQGVKDIWDSFSKMTGGTVPSSEDAINLNSTSSAFKSNILQSIMSTLNQQKGSRFNKMSVDVLEPEVPTIGDDTPQSAFSKLVTLYQRMQRAGSYEADLVRQGIPANSDKFQNMVIDYMKTAPVPGKLTHTGPDGTKYNMGFDEVKKFADGNKIPVPQAIQYLMQNP